MELEDAINSLGQKYPFFPVALSVVEEKAKEEEAKEEAQSESADSKLDAEKSESVDNNAKSDDNVDK